STRAGLEGDSAAANRRPETPTPGGPESRAPRRRSARFRGLRTPAPSLQGGATPAIDHLATSRPRVGVIGSSRWPGRTSRLSFLTTGAVIYSPGAMDLQAIRLGGERDGSIGLLGPGRLAAAEAPPGAARRGRRCCRPSNRRLREH